MRKIIIGTIALFSIAILIFWLRKDPTSDFGISTPGMDSNNVYAMQLADVTIGEHFKAGSIKSNDLQESWPSFRGFDFSNISKSPIKLLKKLSDRPNIVWSKELGEGHAGAAIYKGLVYLLDYDEEDRADVLKCIDLVSGEEVWRRWYKVSIKRNHGISRTIPAITKDYILTIGPKCHIMCLRRQTGDLLWTLDLAKDYGSEVPLWYTGQCPLIDNGVAVIAVGGSDLLLGIDCATGEKLWATPNDDNWTMSHSSIAPYTFEGKKMYVYAAIGGICGVSAEGEDRGKILWKTEEFNPNVVAPSPVCMPDGRIFQCAGYGAGSVMLRLKKKGDELEVEIEDRFKPREGMASEQQTPIYFDGHLIGIQPKDAGGSRNQLICVHPSNPKKNVWTSGKQKRFGLGPYIIADEKIYLLNSDGTLFILKASSKSYQEYDSFQLMEGVDAWAPIAIADGYMILRDSKKLICLNIQE